MRESPRGRPQVDLTAEAWQLALDLRTREGRSVAAIRQAVFIQHGELRSEEWLRLRLPARGSVQKGPTHGR